MTPKDYQDDFHLVHLKDSLLSAQNVVPRFFSYFKPSTVLDVGCGLGTWLSVFKQNKCEIFGIDGDYVKESDLLIEKTNFKSWDLNVEFDLSKKFDLVISLEVAEHIYPQNADTFVNSLTNHADIILFSAAVPGQEGTLHFNEQYNDYWIDKFDSKGYECIDFFRHELWNIKEISWWYRQNILIFIKKSELNNSKYLKIIAKKSNLKNTYIHPELFSYKCYKSRQFENILNSPKAILKYYLNGKKL